jgi:hypothetical protein
LTGEKATLAIEDEIRGGGLHKVEIYFHISENCSLSITGSNDFVISTEGGSVALAVDERLAIEVISASETTQAGWVSRRYHHKVPTSTIIASGEFRGATKFTHTVSIRTEP